MPETKVTADELLSGNTRMRQGSDADDWSLAGTTNYTVDRIDMQLEDGTAAIIAGTVTVTYPLAFANVPHLQLTLNSNDAGATLRKITETATGFTAVAEKPGFVSVALLGLNVNTGLTAATGKVSWTAKGKRP